MVKKGTVTVNPGVLSLVDDEIKLLRPKRHLRAPRVLHPVHRSDVKGTVLGGVSVLGGDHQVPLLAKLPHLCQNLAVNGFAPRNV